MTVLVDALTGEEVTVAQLMGEGEQEEAAKLDEATKAADVLEARMKAARLI